MILGLTWKQETGDKWMKMHKQHKHGENGMGEKDKEFLQEELISS